MEQKHNKCNTALIAKWVVNHKCYHFRECVNTFARVRLMLSVFIQCQFPEDFNVKRVFICRDTG